MLEEIVNVYRALATAGISLHKLLSLLSNDMHVNIQVWHLTADEERTMQLGPSADV